MIKFPAIFIAFMLITFCINNIHAQDSKPDKGKIYGIVVDKDNSQPVEGATVIVTAMKDTVKITDDETDKRGVFSVEVPFGTYRLQVSLTGYGDALVSGVSVTQNIPAVLLDTIKIKQGVTTEQIDVTAEKNVIELTPEKKVFNVEKSIVSSSGSAIDILKNVPSVSVDNDGNVSLKGSQNVRVLIDGKPIFSSISSVLEGIPASSVESIELITNPSAKYEAEVNQELLISF